MANLIAQNRGAILSELPVGTAPLPENFPGRNRILSGLSLGVVIVEAAEKSGSLITARMALEQDRQVFAVPGSPLSGKTRGSNRLIKEGAVLVECVEDVIEEMAPQMSSSSMSARLPAPRVGRQRDGAINKDSLLNDIAQETVIEIQTVLNLLKDAESLHIDAIIESCQLPPQTVLNLLLELELRGMVVQHPGKLFTLP